MPEWRFDDLATLKLQPVAAEQLGLPDGVLELRRAWPRDPQHVFLEYAVAGGRTVAGQWFANEDRLARVARETRAATAAPSTAIPGAGVLLQSEGADRRLTALARLLTLPEATLVVHRAERRAVVRVTGGEGARYVKMVRPERLAAVAARARAGEELAGPAFATPRTLDVDPAAGAITCSALPGNSLHELLGSPRLVPAARRVGTALRALHSLPPPSGEVSPGACADVTWLETWLERLRAFFPDLHGQLAPAAPAVYQALAAGSSPPALLHRDFFDKQVLVDDAGRVGIVDLDTLAGGEPALDVANMLVHLELRAIQGLCTTHDAERAQAAFLAGYGPDQGTLWRLDAYADATRLRLACLYAFRPQWAPIVPPPSSPGSIQRVLDEIPP